MDNDKEYLNNLRHSCAHLLAAAVRSLWPETKNAIGPAIENGFYQDFDLGDVKLPETDFEKIESKMHEIASLWHEFETKEVSAEQARKDFAWNPYKLELIEEFASGGKKIMENNPGNFLDLCKGGHTDNLKEELKHFKLLSVAGAYWRGNEKNKMLTRIYGTAFATKEALDEHLHMLEEAKKRDHRKIGKELGLFVFSDLVGPGLPLFTPKGSTIRRILERFIVDEELKRGYMHVYTPPLAKTDLYKTSGHYPYYKDTMYPHMQVDEDELILRPMTCPHHFMLYKSTPHSYKELPVRLAEISPQFRYEKSGELTGLMRVRMFTLSDAHIIARPDQAEEEINNVLDLIESVNSKFGLVKGKDYKYRLSLGDRNDEKKYYKDDALWNKAEDILRKVLTKRSAPFYEAEAEAAFYGPKIDVQMKNVSGKEETACTVQYDFVMPKRFNLTYIDSDGKEKEPIVIHRASIGAIERTMAFLIEKFGGALPLWLSPVQIVLIPIADRHIQHVHTVNNTLITNNIRSSIDDRSEGMQAKIRDATLQKVPYMGIIGDKEVESSKLKVQSDEPMISVRTRDGKDHGRVKLSDFIKQVQDEIDKKT
ncbi:MAG: threonine--tRNA ligase [Candidatus Levybacteria bacterium RIFCSPLOWO2_01_FULL_37_20]|nr:MAG: threonine--tRNA ligase [Candidatus Levybacteria bacterium RIFCSPHIGHO2_01_FULL_38_12]OGH33484.1 MAG: threonine--tRNA ligase [Candidatus Levybacteria bacterium RIFCSPLOWO2_01_FULL_37_20]OGH44871.1 MAG: threonine--tRNA ligase [Candidatus Levybacteria bacterium RIFCSPLOWO2_02_FULL_37_18]OGH50366.1 MAG: threonine--tRNA ligase [Candidatus Levybacteria bacterium RIFCSPLOWO2_12_FULL_37_7]